MYNLNWLNEDEAKSLAKRLRDWERSINLIPDPRTIEQKDMDEFAAEVEATRASDYPR